MPWQRRVSSAEVYRHSERMACLRYATLAWQHHSKIQSVVRRLLVLIAIGCTTLEHVESALHQPLAGRENLEMAGTDALMRMPR
jgi:hypothetical protein